MMASSIIEIKADKVNGFRFEIRLILLTVFLSRANEILF